MMTPNYEHFKSILLELRSIDDPSHFEGMAEIPNNEIIIYLRLLEDKGLIEGNFFPDRMGGHYIVTRLTHKGHAFLDGIEDESKWQEAKKSISGTSGIANLANLTTLIDFIFRSSN